MSSNPFRILLLIIISTLAISFPISAKSTTDPGSVPGSPQEICPLPLGSSLPDFKVQSLDGKAFDLQAAIRSQPTILIYFRGGW